MTPRAKSRLDETYFRGCAWMVLGMFVFAGLCGVVATIWGKP